MKYRWIESHGNGWRAWIKIRGVRSVGKTRPTKKLAYQDALRMRAEEKARASGDITLEGAQALCVQVGESKGNRPDTQEFYRQQFKILSAAFGPRISMRKITPSMVLRFIRGRQLGNKKTKPVSNNTINHNLRALSRLFSVVQKHGYADIPNPVKSVERPPNEEPTRHALDWKTALGFVETIRTQDPWFADIVELLLWTGLRRAEVCRIRGADFDTQASVINIRPEVRKSRRGTQKPIRPHFLELCKRFEATEGLIVPGKTEELRRRLLTRRFQKWKRTLGVEFRAHVMRHTLGHALGESGAALSVIRDVLGHSPKSVVVTNTYVKGQGEAMNRAIDELGK